MTLSDDGIRGALDYVSSMKLAHSVLAATGLVVIAALVVWAVAGSWRSLVIVFAIALVAGLLTRFAVPRDRRARLLDRLSRRGSPLHECSYARPGAPPAAVGTWAELRG
jgi:hypothetical protein